MYQVTHVAPLHRVVVDDEDDISEQHQAILILEKPPRIEHDLNGLGRVKTGSQPTTVQVRKCGKGASPN
jgi:hypothetical protein